MPTYDLVCTTCGSRFERFLTRFIRETDKVCEACGSTDVVVRPGGGFVAGRAKPSRTECGSHRGGFG